MNKAAIWLAGISITAVIGLAATGLTWWVGRINEDHEVLRQMYWKDFYMTGNVPAVPVSAPTK